MISGDLRENMKNWEKPRCICCGAPLSSGKDFCSEECEKGFFGAEE
jgi:hypothetical protein